MIRRSIVLVIALADLAEPLVLGAEVELPSAVLARLRRHER